MNPHQTTRRRLLWSVLTPIVASIWPGIGAAQRQVVGRIIARNGHPLPNCDIAFYLARNQPPLHRARTNNDGYFSWVNPRYGTFSVLVGKQWFDVTIDGGGMRPSTLVVN